MHRARRILVIHAGSGAAGDMFLGALLDLGANLEGLRQSLGTLALEGWALETERVQRAGVSALKAHVRLAALGGGEELPGMAHGHEHGQGRTEGSGHTHLLPAHGPARSLSEILRIIQQSDLPDGAKCLAERAFRQLGEAEALAHDVPLLEVHFHEVGAVDALIDICGTALLVDALGVEAVHLADLAVGGGHVHCSHGELPVPAPATRHLLGQIPWRMGPVPRELLTPTGAALLRALRASDPPPACEVLCEGRGAGTLDFRGHANVLLLQLALTRS